MGSAHLPSPGTHPASGPTLGTARCLSLLRLADVTQLGWVSCRQTQLICSLVTVGCLVPWSVLPWWGLISSGPCPSLTWCWPRREIVATIARHVPLGKAVGCVPSGCSPTPPPQCAWPLMPRICPHLLTLWFDRGQSIGACTPCSVCSQKIYLFERQRQKEKERYLPLPGSLLTSGQ